MKICIFVLLIITKSDIPVAKDIVETPLMKQYFEIKSKYPDAILLFRVGDFYETFSQDAIDTAAILGITLTRRANGVAQHIELAGFPHHALDTYLPKLVRAGKRVAICDQLEDPKMTKKLVKRGITELVTPGVSMNDNILNQKENNFLAALHYTKTNQIGVAFLDISTGEFMASQGSVETVDKLLAGFAPKEVLIERGCRREFIDKFGSRYLHFLLEDWIFTSEAATDRIYKQFETRSLKGFGLHSSPEAVIAAGAILHYLDITHHTQSSHINTLSRVDESLTMRLDRYTIRSLELVGTINEGGRSLLDTMDRTITPMGGRFLRRSLLFPLTNPDQINRRLEVVDHLFRFPDQKQFISQQLTLISDLERLAAKIATMRINGRELVQLKVSLAAIEPIKLLCEQAANEDLVHLGAQLEPCVSLRELIERTIESEPPILLHKGGTIRKGVHQELDRIREIAYSGKDFLQQIQQRESELTQIPSLKISFNNVFGYYIEVRNTHKDKVPPEWIRKQTLVNAERYITQELKEYEEQILGAEEKIAAIESSIFNDLVIQSTEFIHAIQRDAKVIALLDMLHCFAQIAADNHYIRPIINDSSEIRIQQGRHPVIEKQLPIGDTYIANDLYLDNLKQQIVIITGPNMAGKSALLRQTALIVLMAQVGSFVPAEAATIGWVDKIFTRVGASDNISLGESTFMVEMLEAADIINNATSRSLILFDELGRGTSTYDGISIAWAIVEHLHQHPKSQAKTLFATHYHELNEMEHSFSRIRNYNVSVREVEGKIIFLRKLEPGGSAHSFGIHVAQIAGMPQSITHRANEILSQLESSHRKEGITKPIDHIAQTREGYQLSLFQLDDPVLSRVRDEIMSCNIDHLTPMEALQKLSEIKKIIKGKSD